MRRDQQKPAALSGIARSAAIWTERGIFIDPGENQGLKRLYLPNFRVFIKISVRIEASSSKI
jgi:hypothetical protein